MIYTNQMDIFFDHEAITQDFVIFEARRDKGDYKHSIVPDVALQQCRALSVAYDWGSTCYIMYHRSAAEKCLLKQTLENCEVDVRVQEITSRQLAEKQSYRLAQLLFNAIPSLGANGEMYHNVTGKLYYLDQKWVHRRKEHLVSFWTLQISVTWDHCIKLGVTTFSNASYKRDAWGKPQYLFDGVSFALRRALKEDPDAASDRFVISSLYPDRKNTVPFLEFGTLAEYRSSKVGVLHRFLQDVRFWLARYLSLTMISLDENVHIGNKCIDNKILDIRQRLQKVPLYLEDTVQDNQSIELMSMLRYELEQYSGISLTEGRPEKGSVLIRIIHNKEYYVDSQEQDNYIDAPNDCVVQHVTVEDFQLRGVNRYNTKEKEDPSLRKVIQELAVKLDIYEGRMTCYDWTALGFSSPVAFVTATKSSGDSSKPIRYKRLCVAPDGKLHFDTWEQQYFWTDPEREKIAAAFENNKANFDFQVKGLVYEDANHIHVIRDTERYTLPNMDGLEQVLSTTRDDELLSIEAIVNVVQNKLSAIADNKREQCQKILDNLLCCGKQLSRKELKIILNLKSQLGKELNQLIFDEAGILIGNGLKKRQNRDLYFGGTLDIRHFGAGSTQYYYSGYHGKSLNRSLPHACRIRKVTSTGDILQFEKYLPLLEVDFVRANGWTVVPFPFKYLREWNTK